jgi:hypothetical protein
MKFLFQTILFLISFNSFSQINLKANYNKQEVYIPMRDGTKLYTAIYTPKDISKDKKYPLLLQRTCYSIAPYGEENFKKSLGPNSFLEKDKYVFVYQDVRGRYMSEGVFTNMTPQVEHKTNKDVDEVRTRMTQSIG